MKNKKTYNIRLFYQTYVDVTVEGESRDDAIEEAYCAAQQDASRDQFYMNAEADNYPEILKEY